VFRRRRASPLDKVNLLDVAPVRLATWVEIDGRITLHRPPPAPPSVRTLLGWVLHHLAVRRIRLDAVGTLAWRELDGQQTIAEIAAKLRGAFGEAVEPAEERLGDLVRVLRREGFLAYPGWDPDVPTTPTT